MRYITLIAELILIGFHGVIRYPSLSQAVRRQARYQEVTLLMLANGYMYDNTFLPKTQIYSDIMSLAGLYPKPKGFGDLTPEGP